jgi:tRNA(Arg) A34 adenosine deaminase TadA
MCNSFNKKFLDEAAKSVPNDPNDAHDIHLHFMEEAINTAIKGVNNDEGGPFGCVIVKNGEIIGRGNNKVTSTNDPTAHAEIEAIRNACKYLDSFQLTGCIVYTSCEPCPMCLGAIYWARPDKVYYGCDKKDAASIGFDDEFIYKELQVLNEKKMIQFEQLGKEKAIIVFDNWNDKEDKIKY